VGELVPAVIHDDIARDNALEMIHRLDAAGTLNDEQAKYGELIGMLVSQYEQAKRPTPKVSGRVMLREMMDQHNLKAVEVARLLGISETLISRILKGERSLTWEHAQTLGQRFHLPPDMFMQS
jgi:HTH-type transcriptional regulator/antitoxin HigA